MKFSAVMTLLGFLLASPAGWSADLWRLYQSALKTDPQYQAALANGAAGEEAMTQARALLLPQVNASWSKTDVRSKSEPGTLVFGGTPFPTNPSTTNSDSTSWSVSLNQQIYHHDTWLGLSIAEKQVEQARLALKAERQALAVRLAEAYFELLAAQDNLAFAQAEKASFAKQLEQIRQRFKVGLSAVTDVNEAQARFDQAVANEILAQNTLDNAREGIRQIIGEYPETLAPLKENLPLERPKPADIDAWVRMAEENNVLLLSQRLAVEIARARIQQSEAGHLPTVDLVATYSDNQTDGDNNGTAFANGGNDRRIILQVNVPIFSGGRTSSVVRQAQANFAKASQDLEKTRREVVRNTRSAYLGVTASVASIRALQQSLISSQSALEATQAGFEVGTRTMVDVLQATTNLFNAKRNLARQRYNYVLNVLRLKQAAGILTDEDVQFVNSWLSRNANGQ